MRRRQEYLRAIRLDPDTVVVKLHCTNKSDGKEEARSLEVLDLVFQMIRLAGKKGRTPQTNREVIDHAG